MSTDVCLEIRKALLVHRMNIHTETQRAFLESIPLGTMRSDHYKRAAEYAKEEVDSLVKLIGDTE